MIEPISLDLLTMLVLPMLKIAYACIKLGKAIGTQSQDGCVRFNVSFNISFEKEISAHPSKDKG